MTAPAGNGSLEIDYYLERVGAALADLPQEVREDLMEDLPAHFAEVLEEQGGTLVERLGPPAAYAAELRAAAGLDPAEELSAPSARRGIDLEPWLARVRRADTRLGRIIGYEQLSDFLRLLRPAWWIARGVLLVVLVFALDVIPTDRLDDPIGWLLMAVAAVVSVRVGATGRPRIPRWVHVGIGVLALFGALFVVSRLDTIDSYYSSGYSGGSYYNPYDGVVDVYPVGEDGRLLDNVTLYDQNGNVIEIGDVNRCANNLAGRPETPSYPRCVRPGTHPSPSVGGPSPSPSPSASVSPSPSASVSGSPSR
jgi:hypothetical protein